MMSTSTVVVTNVLAFLCAALIMRIGAYTTGNDEADKRLGQALALAGVIAILSGMTALWALGFGRAVED